MLPAGPFRGRREVGSGEEEAVRKNAARVILLSAILILTVSIDCVCAGDGPVASISFCSRVGKESGTLYGVSDVFTLRDEAKVYGVIDLTNVRPGEELVLHVLWLTPDGRDAFLKRVVVKPDGPEARVETSLSLSPRRRDPGAYRLKVYLFRMLLAEKPVEFVPAE
jgi:hypothetical protein